MSKEGKNGQQPKPPEYRPTGFFAFRTALLPLQEFLQWGEGVGKDAEADRKVLQERLRAVIENPVVREAIFIASPRLDKGIQDWLKDPESKEGKKAEQAMVRYFTRMCSRSTPFGLFAGCSVGKMGKETKLAIKDMDAYRRHTRLDMDYLFELVEELCRRPDLRRQLIYRPNSSLYRTGGRLRYAESRMQNKMRSYHLVAVDETDYLLSTLKKAGEGARLEDLAEDLTGDEVTQEEAEEYITELIDSQILVPELAPAVTGPEPIYSLLEKLQGVEGLDAEKKTLDGIRKTIEKINGSKLGIDTSEYKKIAEALKALPTKVELSRLFQIDMVKPDDGATLGEDIIEKLKKGVGYLQVASGVGGQDVLSRFAQEFTRKYEGREVPLVEVLDEELGIGFNKSQAPTAEASPLLDGLVFPEFSENYTQWGNRENFLLKKLLEAKETGAMEIRLEEKELGHLVGQNQKPLPNAFSVMASLGAPDEKGNHQIYLSGCSGPSGANLLGRFCHGDQELTENVRKHIKEEEELDPDTIYAEVTHLPEGRLGNILLRPVLREHEIPFLGASGVDHEHQILVNDLDVSVFGGQVILRSRKLGKRVIPRLTSAHGFFTERNLSVYRFLGALQQHNVNGGMSWQWGALDNAPFLPRVILDSFLLSRAKWNISGQELGEFKDKKGGDLLAAMKSWREKRQIPRYAALADADNELPVDFENILSIESFLQVVKKRPGFSLVEKFPGHQDLVAEGPEGKFVSEIVVPFVQVKEQATSPRGGLNGQTRDFNSTRFFLPGSEWIYAKFYTGTSTADQILREVIAPVRQKALESGAADSWFFIRYGDPDWHLRVRFHGDPKRLQEEVLPLLHGAAAPLLADGQLAKLQLDTYERESERYGGPLGMVYCEQIFAADSEASLAIVESYTGDALADARWRLTLKGMDMFLEDMGLDLEKKHEILKRIRRGFGEEFHADDSYLKHLLGKKHRAEKKTVEQLLGSGVPEGHPLTAGMEALQARSGAMKTPMTALKALEQRGRLFGPFAELASSFLHMHANRILRSAARAQELVLYDFLERYYASQLARQRKAKPEKAK